MLGFFTWDLDPVLLALGPLQIRFYGVFFALTIWTGYKVWEQQCLKNGESRIFADRFLWWGVIAIVGGSRLGHVLFYEPKTFFMPWTRPHLQAVWDTLPFFTKVSEWLEFLKFWKGGLASHGATVGLITALWLFARKYERTWFRLADYLGPAIAIAAGGVRIGNFFNSEIVGREACQTVAGSLQCEVPWAVKFVRYCHMEGIPAEACVPRHPSQIYEFLMGVFTFGVVMAVERAKIRRAGSGLIAGVFLTCYFSCRFTVEFFKEFQIEQLRTDGPLGAIEQALGVHFRMGQWLSVLPILLGLYCIVRALRQDKDAIPEPVPLADPDAPEPSTVPVAPARKRK